MVPRDEQCSLEEFIDGDSTIQTCVDVDGEHWEDDFFNDLNRDGNTIDDDDDNSGEEMDVEAPPPKTTTFVDAIRSLEDVQLFLNKQGHVAEANNFGSTIADVTKLHCKQLISASRQSTIEEFFQ